MTSPLLTVAVVSPLPALSSGLTAMLGRHPDRVEVVDLRAAVPDVVLYDTSPLALGNGADLDLLLATTTARVLAMTYELRPQLASVALRHGVHGSFDVATGSADLLAAITAAAAPSVRNATVEAVVPLRLGHEVGLTPREVDVLSMITAGLSNQEIAEGCYLSINSVKTYIRSAYRRIGVTSRSQAVVWCVQHGFAGAVAA